MVPLIPDPDWHLTVHGPGLLWVHSDMAYMDSSRERHRVGCALLSPKIHDLLHTQLLGAAIPNHLIGD